MKISTYQVENRRYVRPRSQTYDCWEIVSQENRPKGVNRGRLNARSSDENWVVPDR